MNFKYLNWLTTFQLKKLNRISFFLDARDSAGTNQFFIKEAFSLVKTELEKADGSSPDIKEIEIKGKELSSSFSPKFSVVFDEIYAQDMFSTSRVILVTAPSTWFKEYAEHLKGVLDSPPEGLFLLFRTTGIDTRTKFGKLAQEKADMIEFPRMFDAPPSWGQHSNANDNDYTRWITNRARLYQKKISLDNAMLLLSLIGTNLQSLDSQLNMLSIYDGSVSEITQDHIHALVKQPAGISAYKVVDAIMNKNLTESLSLTRRMFLYGLSSDTGKLEVDESNIFSYSFLPLLFKRFKRILDTLRLMQKGASIKEAAEEQGIPSYFVNTLQTDVKNFGRPAILELAMTSLIDADLKAKTTATSAAWLAEDIILKLLAPRNQ